MSSNWVNYGLESNYDYTNRQFSHLYDIWYRGATLNYVHTTLQAIRSKEPVLIRADIVNEGTDQEWVKYRSAIHGYIMFGNFLDRTCAYGIFIKISSGNQVTFLNGEDIKFGETTNKIYRECSSGKKIKAITRFDVNPSKPGGEHYEWGGKLAPPQGSDHFSFKCWPNSSDSNSIDYLDKIEPGQKLATLTLK